MRYALGCAFNIKDLFIKFPYEKLLISSKKCEELFGNYHRRFLAHRIFKDAFKLVVYDAIQNNATFELPTGSKKCDIHVTRIEGEKFKKARQRGAFKNVDFLKSNFTGNILTFNMYSNNRHRMKPIHLNKDFKNLLDENTNNGKQYC